MKSTWNRIERWLGRNAPDALKRFRRPAPAERVARAEARIGVKFPKDLRAWFAIHDGQDWNHQFAGNWRMLPLSEVMDSWKVWTDLLEGGDFDGNKPKAAKGVAKAWWRPEWVPLAENGGGDLLCVDVAPAAGGTAGQLIKVWHADPDRNLVAPGIEPWMKGLADGLEGGTLRFSKQYGIVDNSPRWVDDDDDDDDDDE